jgi:hypothetical protein
MSQHRAGRWTWTVAGACVVGCACVSAPSDRAAPPVEILALSPEPTVSIGVVEGDEEYELHDAVGSIRLVDGRLVVANAGSSHLLFFDSLGRFIKRAGGRGGGPGEFRWLTAVYTHGNDSMLVVDGAGNRLSVFDTSGRFTRLAPADSVSGDSVFPADVWLYRRFWVKGALTPAQRNAARRVLDEMPLPQGHPPYRFAQLDADGNVWFREPLDPADPDAHWSVVSPDGRLTAIARIARQFEPHVIGTRTVLGRWRDENDVNFIRLYELRATPETAPPPAWLGGESAEAAMISDQRELAAALEGLKRSLIHVVTAQEGYYADHATYTAWADSLRWDVPEGTVLDVLTGDSRGWIGVATAVGVPGICAMAVGAPTPAGWPEGVARCSVLAKPDR